MKLSRTLQTTLTFSRRGGAREGAGRKREDGRLGVGVPHLARPRLDGRTPVHVTLRLCRDVPNLRSQRGMRVVVRVFATARDRLGVRLVQWAAQRDHLHLIAEPQSEGALSRGLQGLCIRLAKRLNRTFGRRGRVFADRYHALLLRTPRQTRSALAYVLLNERHHAVDRGHCQAPGLDACSSSPAFDGWTLPRPPTPGFWSATVTPAATWLLRVGWKRHGLIDPLESQAPARLDAPPRARSRSALPPPGPPRRTRRSSPPPLASPPLPSLRRVSHGKRGHVGACSATAGRTNVRHPSLSEEQRARGEQAAQALRGPAPSSPNALEARHDAIPRAWRPPTRLQTPRRSTSRPPTSRKGPLGRPFSAQLELRADACSLAQVTISLRPSASEV